MNQHITLDAVNIPALLTVLTIVILIQSVRAAAWKARAEGKDEEKDLIQQRSLQMAEYFDSERKHNGDLQDRLVDTFLAKKEDPS